MHFLIFSAQYLPTMGGVERYTLNLADTLQAQGHSVVIVTSALPNLPTSEIQTNGVEIIRVNSLLPLKGRFPILKPFAFSTKKTPTLYQKKFDFALINTRFYPLSLFAAKFCKKQNIPAIVLEHGTAYLSLGNKIINLFANIYEILSIKYVKHYCKNFYGVSNACNQWLTHFGIQSQGVLYNAVNPKSLQVIAQNCTVNYRQKYKLNSDTPIIVFSGRFIKEKGIFELLSAFSLLQNKIPSATLIMAGDGPYYQEITSKNIPHVICTGALPFEESIALLAQATVFCLPTYSEGFSTVLLEACAVKTPIITTATGGSPELIKNSSYGILLKSIEPSSLAAALEKALSNKEWQQNAVQNAYQVLLKNFTWKQTASNFFEIAQEKIKKNK